MKKILFTMLLILSVITFSGCNKQNKDSNMRDTDLEYLLLSKSEEKQNYISTNEYRNFISLLGNFSTDLSEKMYKEFNTNLFKLGDGVAISKIKK